MLREFDHVSKVTCKCQTCPKVRLRLSTVFQKKLFKHFSIHTVSHADMVNPVQHAAAGRQVTICSTKTGFSLTQTGFSGPYQFALPFATKPDLSLLSRIGSRRPSQTELMKTRTTRWQREEERRDGQLHNEFQRINQTKELPKFCKMRWQRRG